MVGESSDTRYSKLIQFAPNIWVKDYPIQYSGCTFFGRMTVVKLEDGRVLLHSPCEIDDATKSEIDDLGGEVAVIVAPGTYHHLHIPSCQSAFPEARTYICPGLETKRPDLKFDGIIGDDRAEKAEWEKEFDLEVVKGCRFIWEVALLHRSSRTLILVDIIENIGDHTPGTNWVLRFFWKYVFFMWNNPKPAPEYRMGWKDTEEARGSMNRILEWDFDKVIVSHGDNVSQDGKDFVRRAWSGILEQ
mmetsp:Transcript_28377/g.52826  ORF Transcript_28377/g.52826 Transcript_28377/m.52826 type:complete len:246 (-) Transcript_28377:433-1170(-)